MSDVTVVCCWTNEKMYSDFVRTLKYQTVPCELIGIDNRRNKGFTSCASAYNSIIDNVKTKYVIYSHQDILLAESNSMEKFLSYLEELGHDDILGVAGTRFDTEGTFSNFRHKDGNTGDLMQAGRNHFDGEIMECDTIDECFFGGYTEHFRNYPFDEVLCDNWHLYAVEECIRAKSLGIGKIFVCNIPIIHLSYGTMSLTFYYGFYRLCRKYAGKIPLIRTTCVYSRTDFIHLLPRFLYLCGGVILRNLGLYDFVKKLFH